MKLSFIRFFLCCVLIFATQALAQEPAQDLHDSLAEDSLRVDSLHVDSLSKISLALDVDTNKVEHIDAGVNDVAFPVKDYYPEGFIVEAAYAAPAVVHLSFWRFRVNDESWTPKWLKKFGVLLGFPAVSLDVGEGGISDEGILSLVLFFLCLEQSDFVMNTMITLNYLMFGDTYFPLSGNGRFGVFEKHRILDYALYDWGYDKPWEFGFSEALGLRVVLSKDHRHSGYYADLGAHVRITNQRFRYGLFVQLGSFSTHK